jgi:REP element-mobilizing transposase RayT
MLGRKAGLGVQKQHHFYGGNHLHFISASTYRRVCLFNSPRFRKRFIQTLDQLRNEFDSRLVGYVVMPDHFHNAGLAQQRS